MKNTGCLSKLLLGGALSFMITTSVSAADKVETNAAYKNCINSVVFELKKKTQARISVNWSKNGDLFARYNNGGRDEDIGPDSPEQVLFKLEQLISPDVASVQDSTVRRMCSGK